MKKGKVYLVGAGPGDQGLITVKGSKLITEADVILYDHLIPLELLVLARPDAEIISVGKFAAKHTLPQDSINNLLVEKAAEGKKVVRLKGGDPILFGRGGEEAIACCSAGIEFEIVPAPTSAIAGASYAGIPVTHREYSSSVAIITGHRKDEKNIKIPQAETLIFLMSVANIANIIDRLIEVGFAADTKIAAVERAACYDQRVITATLENFLSVVKKEKLRKPAIFIVGKVVELHEKLNWFEKKPNIFLAGTHPEKYQHLGNIVHRPLIKLIGLDDYSKTDKTLREIDLFDWIIFTSTNGVEFFFKRLNKLGFDTRALANAKIAAIGNTTAEKLMSFGIKADLIPETETSEALLEKLKKENIANKNILLVRPEVSTETLRQGIKEANAKLLEAVVYKNVTIEPAEIDFAFIDQILFTSGSTVHAFIKQYGSVPEHIKVFCMGKPSLEVARSYGINAEILPEKIKPIGK